MIPPAQRPSLQICIDVVEDHDWVLWDHELVAHEDAFHDVCNVGKDVLHYRIRTAGETMAATETPPID